MSREFEVGEDGRALTTFVQSRWRTSGHFELDGQGYEIRARGFAGRYELLSAGGTVVAAADHVGRRHWSVRADGREYRFHRESLGGRAVSMVDSDDRVIGSVTAGRRGQVSADLPGMELRLRVFVVGAMLLQLRRKRAAAASAASSGG
ncbi:hypothetical protein GTW43_26500 [Streptomyces sp. SID5785]|uniref:hypothetical protein n=1 Tax=Streptomyces sp. SID5785 TaxID=2690309 RepID=UPI001361E5D1|nr:hypothetical protein [Streptomyces sp. SID5785]MZD07960.1 hypothetical protein [Streptomyces sp. SID5785]MZD08603.1 hypothetical protein [Streptomyces sp. SID5785]